MIHAIPVHSVADIKIFNRSHSRFYIVNISHCRTRGVSVQIMRRDDLLGGELAD
jgi:hypothetical protein